MPFEEFPGGVTVTGRNSITLYRMMVLRSAVRLESTGIKVRRGGRATWTSVKKEFGIEGGRKAVLMWLEGEILKLEAQVKEGQEGKWGDR